ncbi:alpha/beta fold hydrolase [Alkalihalobacillus sp. FSL W8-0930]
MENKPEIHVTPRQALIDECTTITVSGCTPEEKLDIELRLIDQQDREFKSSVCINVNEKGEQTLPQSDVEGLFWSAEEVGKVHGDYFYKSDAAELEMKWTLKREGEEVDQVTAIRAFKHEDVSREVVREDGVVGTLFYQEQDMVKPVVVVLGGSDGEIQEHAAALLATKGYNVFALAYFGQEGVPKDLDQIPLESFDGAIQWVKGRFNIEKVTLIGYSRGAEAALLLASVYPDEFKAVVAGAPGAYVTSGLRNTIYAPIPSWTLKGKDLPYLTFKYRPAQMFSMLGGMIKRKPVSFLSIWENSLSKPEKLEASRIEVERINAPLLLIAGGQDQVWPSERFARQIAQEIEGESRELHFEEAGHFLAFPYALPGMPANVLMHVGGRMIMDFGGTKAANAEATKKSWKELLCFLEEFA